MIKYPINKNTSNKQNNALSASNRGMKLEKAINLSNTYYLNKEIANIHKKPTPIQVVSVDYPKRQAAKITEAYYKIPSTTDYNGIYRGKYLDFEAKETKSKTSFAFKNIHSHQINHLKSIINLKGIAFFIICFSHYHETYVIEAINLINRINENKKSISYQEIKEEGYLIKESYQLPLDYLSAVDNFIK
ncbi:MAG: Holliday junction resolvase RecU [Bacilli bacterium]|nr:Holliday junction resolvase RecU [Bacilli bacterium]